MFLSGQGHTEEEELETSVTHKEPGAMKRETWSSWHAAVAYMGFLRSWSQSDALARVTQDSSFGS